MRSVLEALQAGRLIELPEDRNLEKAITILGNLLEAIPSVPPNTDVVGAVLTREKSGSTALGRGWACPHARIPTEGDLLCTVGWSPLGVDYDTPDKQPVHVMVMYLVPLNQKNAYLKEVSIIAKALQTQPNGAAWKNIHDLNEVRNRLLDLVAITLEAAAADSRARMIRLEAKQAAPPAPVTLAGLAIQPLSIVSGPGIKPIILTQDRGLVELLETVAGLTDTLQRQGMLEIGGWRVLSRGTTNYQADRVLFDCLALKIMPASS